MQLHNTTVYLVECLYRVLFSSTVKLRLDSVSGWLVVMLLSVVIVQYLSFVHNTNAKYGEQS